MRMQLLLHLKGQPLHLQVFVLTHWIQSIDKEIYQKLYINKQKFGLVIVANVLHGPLLF
jgi:hypothetical protein